MDQPINDTLEESLRAAELRIKRFYKSSFGFEPGLLRSALFRPAIGERAVYPEYKELAAMGNAKVLLKGTELRQDDLRVLLALIKQVSGGEVNWVICFVPRTFCRESLGWADSGDSVAKLKACIRRLQDAKVQVVRADGTEDTYIFVGDSTIKPGTKWYVWLSERLASMFQRHVTFLDVKERLALNDGLESWLYGIIRADSCTVPFDLTDLRRAAASTYAQKDFNKNLRRCLRTLTSVGAVRRWAVAKGKLSVFKN